MRSKFALNGLFFILLSCSLLLAQDQSKPGAGNQRAIEISGKSPRAQSAHKFLLAQAKKIQDEQLRKETLDAISNPQTCIRHRANLTQQDKERILQELVKAGLVEVKDQTGIPGGLIAGIFPPVIDDGTDCPHLPQPFTSAPGSDFGGHHSYPGGLPIHEANNEMAALSLADDYRKMYGRKPASSGPEVFIDEDVIIAAPIWHDWAKTTVFQWNNDGTEFQELQFGGNGDTDDNGKPGDSKTGAHHILGLAETMKRGLSPVMVITQASAHVAPSLGHEFEVVNWLRTAAIIAQVDPVQKGYLTTDKHGRLRLPAVRNLGTVNLLNADPPQTNLLAEYTIHNRSDADISFSIPSIKTMQILLRQLAPEFGFDPEDTLRYNNSFRNPVLSFLTAERLMMIYGEKGLEGIKDELRSIQKQGLMK